LSHRALLDRPLGGKYPNILIAPQTFFIFRHHLSPHKSFAALLFYLFHYFRFIHFFLQRIILRVLPKG